VGGETIEVRDKPERRGSDSGGPDPDPPRAANPSGWRCFPIPLLHIMLRAKRPLPGVPPGIHEAGRWRRSRVSKDPGHWPPSSSPFDWMRMFLSPGSRRWRGPRKSDEAREIPIESREGHPPSLPRQTIEQLSPSGRRARGQAQATGIRIRPQRTNQGALPGHQQRQVRGPEDRKSK